MKRLALKKKLLIFTILVASLLAVKCDRLFVYADTSTNNSSPGNTKVEDFRIADIAKKITVRVSGDRRSGSGVIVARQEKTIQSKKIYSYLVLTSNHNLANGSKNEGFHIFTPDGLVYPATLMSDRSRKLFPKEDLDVVYFQSYQQTPYEVATQPQDPNFSVSQDSEITIAGFPCDGEGCPNVAPLTFTKGKAYPSQKSLERGYQIGFDRDIKENTSGGPALNIRGELIGVIGRRTDVYGVPSSQYTFADGSKPSPQDIEKFRHLSWIIPLKKTSFDLTEKLLKEVPTVNNNLSSVIDAEDTKKAAKFDEFNNKLLTTISNIHDDLWRISFVPALLVLMWLADKMRFTKKD
jgi:hypothetical protein